MTRMIEALRQLRAASPTTASPADSPPSPADSPGDREAAVAPPSAAADDNFQESPPTALDLEETLDAALLDLSFYSLGAWDEGDEPFAFDPLVAFDADDADDADELPPLARAGRGGSSESAPDPRTTSRNIQQAEAAALAACGSLLLDETADTGTLACIRQPESDRFAEDVVSTIQFASRLAQIALQDEPAEAHFTWHTAEVEAKAPAAAEEAEAADATSEPPPAVVHVAAGHTDTFSAEANSTIQDAVVLATVHSGHARGDHYSSCSTDDIANPDRLAHLFAPGCGEADGAICSVGGADFRADAPSTIQHAQELASVRAESEPAEGRYSATTAEVEQADGAAEAATPPPQDSAEEVAADDTPPSADVVETPDAPTPERPEAQEAAADEPAQPAAEETPPVEEDAQPVADEAPPDEQEAQPGAEEAQPAAEEAEPVAEEENEIATVDEDTAVPDRPAEGEAAAEEKADRLETSEDAPRPSPAEQSALADLANQQLAGEMTALGERLLSDLSAATSKAAVLIGAEYQPHVGDIALRTATALCRDGRRHVLLIDAALADKHLTAGLGMSLESGLAEVLKGRVSWQKAVRATATRGLCVLPAGRLAPPRLVATDNRLKELLRELSGQWDLVLIDAGCASDPSAANVMSAARGVYLVVRLGETDEQAAVAAIDSIRACSADFGGCVVTNA